MDLSFRASLAEGYTSTLQKIRIVTENWVGRQAYCPNCGQHSIDQYPNNSRVGDFFCGSCKENYELKSQGRTFGPKVVDGAYGTMIQRLESDTAPNLFLLHYAPEAQTVVSLLIIPKHFLVPEIIEEKRPLSPAARRAGWIGCNIRLNGIPLSGRIFMIKNGIVAPRRDVFSQWHRTLFLRQQKSPAARGWLLSVMKCVEKLNRNTFSIEDIYQFEAELKLAYPCNKHVKEKIRQKLQVLRDNGYLEFVSRGTYRLAAATSPVR